MTVVGSREDEEDVDESRGEGARDFAKEEGGGTSHAHGTHRSEIIHRQTHTYSCNYKSFELDR